MPKKCYIVTDLGPGDGGKGGVVHKIATMVGAHTIIKVGGAQGSHGVMTSRGEKFAFSQWGCGTFEGIKTHISSRLIVSPEGLLNEANALRYNCGIHNAFNLLTVDRRAICATPYHGIASRLKEMERGNNPRGTIGTGVGEAYRDSFRLPELIIRAHDLTSTNIGDKLKAVRERQILEMDRFIKAKYLHQDLDLVTEQINLLNDPDFLDYNVERFREVGKLIQLVVPDYMKYEVLSQPGIVVVESSHGVLTDNRYGFYPHTSAIRTLPCFTEVMLRKTDYDGKIVNIGVSRAYQIRHGAGPMPTVDTAMTEDLLPDSNKEENRYQGKVRVGPLDLVLLRYAISVCGGPTAFDGLAITWFDQIQQNGVWHICHKYQKPTNMKFFSPLGNLLVCDRQNSKHRKFRKELTNELLRCRPIITTYSFMSNTKREELFSLCADILYKELGIPVRMVSFGPTEKDKLCK